MKNYASNIKNEYNFFFNLMKYKFNFFIYNIKLIEENIPF